MPELMWKQDVTAANISIFDTQNGWFYFLSLCIQALHRWGQWGTHTLHMWRIRTQNPTCTNAGTYSHKIDIKTIQFKQKLMWLHNFLLTLQNQISQRSVQHLSSNWVYGQAVLFWQGFHKDTHPQVHSQHTGAAPVQSCTNTKHNTVQLLNFSDAKKYDNNNVALENNAKN
jgi:hypothetical protein